MKTSAESREQQPPRSAWGGKRAGAGRRPREADKWIKARGLSPATAAELLERADERRRSWYRLLNSEDDSVALRAVMYLTDRRDGKAAQQINVTSTSVTFSAEDLARAREIAREIRAGQPRALPAPTAATEGVVAEHFGGS